MAKKQTRRSISVSRTTYERLKTFCETNNISMSQFVETRVGDFLGEGASQSSTIVPAQPRPTPAPAPAPKPMLPPKATAPTPAAPIAARPVSATTTQEQVRQPAPAPMTSAAARYAIEPPPPIIKPRQQEAAPKPAEKRPDQIFTF